MMLVLLTAGPALAQAPATGLLSRVAFGSCLDTNCPQPVWEAVIAARPQVFIFLDTTMSSADLPPALRSTCEALGGTGLHESRLIGPSGQQVQIVLLDTRAATNAPSRAILGAGQWTWFRQQLRTPARLRLVCSGIQVVAEGHEDDKWIDHAGQRGLLFDMISDTEADGVVFLSARRYAEISMTDAGVGYPLYDVTPGSLNAPSDAPPAEINSRRISELFTGAAFGLVTIDWGRPDPLVTIEVLDEKGTPRLSHQFTLDALRIAGAEGL